MPPDLGSRWYHPHLQRFTHVVQETLGFGVGIAWNVFFGTIIGTQSIQQEERRIRSCEFCRHDGIFSRCVAPSLESDLAKVSATSSSSSAAAAAAQKPHRRRRADVLGTSIRFGKLCHASGVRFHLGEHSGPVYDT